MLAVFRDGRVLEDPGSGEFLVTGRTPAGFGPEAGATTRVGGVTVAALDHPLGQRMMGGQVEFGGDFWMATRAQLRGRAGRWKDRFLERVGPADEKGFSTVGVVTVTTQDVASRVGGRRPMEQGRAPDSVTALAVRVGGMPDVGGASGVGMALRGAVARFAVRVFHAGGVVAVVGRVAVRARGGPDVNTGPRERVGPFATLRFRGAPAGAARARESDDRRRSQGVCDDSTAPGAGCGLRGWSCGSH